MGTFDERVGTNVRRFRCEAGMTQDFLAEWMRRSGHEAWKHQAVTSKVELGVRRLLLAEAATLAEALNVSIYDLIE